MCCSPAKRVAPLLALLILRVVGLGFGSYVLPNHIGSGAGVLRSSTVTQQPAKIILPEHLHQPLRNYIHFYLFNFIFTTWSPTTAWTSLTTWTSPTTRTSPTTWTSTSAWPTAMPSAADGLTTTSSTSGMELRNGADKRHVHSCFQQQADRLP